MSLSLSSLFETEVRTSPTAGFFQSHVWLPTATTSSRSFICRGGRAVCDYRTQGAGGFSPCAPRHPIRLRLSRPGSPTFHEVRLPRTMVRLCRSKSLYLGQKQHPPGQGTSLPFSGRSVCVGSLLEGLVTPARAERRGEGALCLRCIFGFQMFVALISVGGKLGRGLT